MTHEQAFPLADWDEIPGRVRIGSPLRAARLPGARAMSARDDYPLALAGMASGQWQAMCNEIDRLRQWKAEAMQVLAERPSARLGGPPVEGVDMKKGLAS